MKQRIQLQIPEPCHENWNSMTDTQQGRFCMSCQKEVIDFSGMADKEILAYISKASSGICGRVADDQVNRNLVMPREPKKILWRYWVSIAASFVLLSSKSNAQVKRPANPIVNVPKGKNEIISDVVTVGAIAYIPEYKQRTAVHGRIVDDKNNPVPYATIKVKYSTAGIAADGEGYFVLYTKPGQDEIELQVSSVGYKSVDIEVSKSKDDGNRIEAGNIVLIQTQMKEVVVTAGSLKGRLGGLMVCRYTRYSMVKSKFKDVLGISEVKVYPNPIAVNSIFNINFNLKDTGEYAVQFTDASGKIILASQLNIVSKNQVQSFNSNMFSSHGIYFVSVTNKQSFKMFTAKLMVQ